MGKYNLNTLGWKNFEHLVCTVMQYVLGATYTPFSEGADGGRDGFFWGVAKESILSDASLQGKFVFQCKHTSKTQEAFSLSNVEKEIPKVRKLVGEYSIDHYIILTNYKVAAKNEAEITRKFLEINGLRTCIVLGEEWFEARIDAEPILRRLVPRLYGIGDLSQIVDERARDQSLAILEQLQGYVDTFVSTKAYQEALTAIDQHNFVVLLGPPSVGKSSIAATICMTSKIEDEIKDVYVFSNADQFETHWNPLETKCLYWFDDVFGATSLDHQALLKWTRLFRSLNAAISKGNKVIFTSRNYIFFEARDAIKQSDFPLLFHSQVVINTSDLTQSERTMILYNHIKSGNISKERKTELKPFLSFAAEHPSFTPELARRLGSTYFSSSLQISKKGINDFFENPTSYFEEIISNLSDSKKAAMFLILMHNNQLPSPVTADSMLACIMSAYPAELPQIRQALEYMKGDLVKHIKQSNQSYWSLHHPSMIDSLLHILSNKVEMVELYLRGADFYTIVANTSCRHDSLHKIFVPESLWPLLIDKLTKTSEEWMNLNFIARYVSKEGSNELLHWLRAEHNPMLIEIVKPIFRDLSHGYCWGLAARLLQMGLLDEEVHSAIVGKIKKTAKNWGDFSFVSEPDLSYILGEEEVEKLKKYLYSMGPDWFEKVRNQITSQEDCQPSELEKLLETATLYESILKSLNTRSGEEIEEELEYIRSIIEESLDEFPSNNYSYHSTNVLPTKANMLQLNSIYEDVDQ